MISDRRGKELGDFAAELTEHEATYMRGLLREPQRTGMLLKKSDVAKWAGISEKQVEILLQKGEFPQPTLFGERTPRWQLSTLHNWIGKSDE